MHILIQELQQYHRDKAQHLTELKHATDWLLEDDQPKNLVQELQHVFRPFQDRAEAHHHHNEELIVRELRSCAAPIHRRVDEIEDDHAALDRVVATISMQIERLPKVADLICVDLVHFIRMYDDHATGEESIFFPFSDEHLSDQHWLRIEKEWQAP